MMDKNHIIPIQSLPALQGVLWDRHVLQLRAEDVFRLYEDRWRYIDQEQMSKAERELLDELTRDIGNGFFLGR